MESSELPPSDNKNTLTPEQETRCNRDIRSIAALSTLAQTESMIAVVGGGYATEAHCRGQITRPHGDVDLAFYSATPPDNTLLSEKISDQLAHEQTYTHWRGHPTDHEERQREITDGHIEFREGDKDLIPFSERRRIEIEVYHDEKAAKRYVMKKLIDSEGVEYAVNVVRLSYLVAEKVQRLYEVSQLTDTEKNKFGRETRPTDFSEVKRLISLPDFDEKEKQMTLEIIARRLNRDLAPSASPIDPNTVFTEVTTTL